MKASTRFALGAFVTAFMTVLLTGAASATTFCVPGYFDACPDNGSNVLSVGSGPAAKLEAAMGLDANDGIPDVVYLDSGTYADPDAFTATTSGTDDLTVIGNGRDRTFLTSGTTANSYVLNLITGNVRHITVKDLAIVVPESFPNGPGYGSAVQSKGDDFESVDVINENAPQSPGEVGSSGIANVVDGGRFTDIRIFGKNGARFSDAFGSLSCGTGQVTVERAEFSDSRYGVSTGCPNLPFTIDRATFRGVDSALQISNGARVDASNVLIESGDLVPIDLYNGQSASTTVANIDHATVVATGNAGLPAVRAKVSDQASATGSIQINLSNSIVTGFQKTWDLEAPVNDSRGDADAWFRYSSFDQVGNDGGDVGVNLLAGNISGAPGFAGITDYRLKAGSPAIDAGDPAANDPILDLDGNARPLDGDRDGNAIRDMGAYEFEPAPPGCPDDPSACPKDTVPPKISKVKFHFKRGKGGALRLRVSEAANVLAVLTPVPKKAKGKKRKVVRIARKAKQGPVKIRLGKRRLKPGRYTLRITATDEAGNRSKPIRRKVRAKRPGRVG